MTDITTHTVIAMFDAIAGAMADNKDLLCELDGVIGDADHGITMDLGFSTVVRALAGLDPVSTEPTVVFNTAAKAFLNAVGASSGPLYATAFMRAGAAVKGKPTLTDADFAAAFIALAKGIQERGKAETGEKTMVDAWASAAAACEMASAAGAPLATALDAAIAAAQAGAEATKTMIATKGRSARLGDRSLGHRDAGAASAVMIIAAMRSVLA